MSVDSPRPTPVELRCENLVLPLRAFRLEATFSCASWPLILLGPSGAGKSVLLRVLAGLATPVSGRVSLNGETWLDVSSGLSRPAHLRRIGYCGQEPMLFPHLNVIENVAYPLKHSSQRGPGECPSKQDRRDKAREELASWGGQGLVEARAGEISGGEQARVALARAFVARPRLLLLDEPFSSLDPPTQSALAPRVQARLRELGTPAIWVTHDREEALTLGRTMAVLLNGRIAQVGTPEDIFRLPADPEVASFVGIGAVLHGLVQAREAGVMRVRCGPILLRAAGNLSPGTSVVAMIRSEEVELLPADTGSGEGARASGVRTSARNELAATVVSLRPQGLNVIVDLDAGLPMVAAVTKPAAQDLGLRPGLPVHARIKAVAVQVRTEVWGGS